MSQPFRKFAVDALLDMVENPAESVWQQLSQDVVQHQGPAAYERALVPGFPETQGKHVLWGGQGLRNELEEADQSRKERISAKRGKQLALWLKKVSSTNDQSQDWEYEEGGRQQYWPETSPNPETGDYSARRARDNTTGRSIAWDQVGEGFYRDSTMAEPAFLNQDNYNTSTTHTYDP